MSGFDVVCSDIPMSVTEAVNKYYYCSPIYSTQQSFYCHPSNMRPLHTVEHNSNESLIMPMDGTDTKHGHSLTTPVVRVVRKRTTANKKERKRTQSINAAFQDLRDRIPNVPADTKLSKIKTLRLATSYISYLMVVLETNKPALDFRADLIAGELHPSKRSLNRNNGNSLSIGYNFRDGRAPLITHFENTHLDDTNCVENTSQKTKARTGWPQHVWALELKQEQNL